MQNYYCLGSCLKISRPYLDEIQKDYHIYGLRNEDWETFEKEIEYEAFLAKRKK